MYVPYYYYVRIMCVNVTQVWKTDQIVTFDKIDFLHITV